MMHFPSHEKMCIRCKQYNRDSGKSQYGKVILIPGNRYRCDRALSERESDAAGNREDEKTRNKVLLKKLAQIEGNLRRGAVEHGARFFMQG